MGLLMARFRRCLTELSAINMIMAGYHNLTFLLPYQQNISKTIGARALKLGELIGNDE